MVEILVVDDFEKLAVDFVVADKPQTLKLLEIELNSFVGAGVVPVVVDIASFADAAGRIAGTVARPSIGFADNGDAGERSIADTEVCTHKTFGDPFAGSLGLSAAETLDATVVEFEAFSVFKDASIMMNFI